MITAGRLSTVGLGRSLEFLESWRSRKSCEIPQSLQLRCITAGGGCCALMHLMVYPIILQIWLCRWLQKLAIAVLKEKVIHLGLRRWKALHSSLGL
jgi:hypothetical protein